MGNITGAGDVVAAVTNFLGIVPCGACKERQRKWNKMFPIKLKPREMTPEELETWRTFREVRSSLRLTNEQRLMVCKIYSDVFKVQYYEVCPVCDPAPLLRMIERMDAIFETYE